MMNMGKANSRDLGEVKASKCEVDAMNPLT